METGNVYQEFNIAEILRYAPKGLKLYSPLLGEVRLEKVSDHDDTIVVTTKYKSERVFFEDGKYDSNGECLLFPSKDHREWNNWQNILFPKSIGSVCVHNITDNKFILGEDGTYFSDNTGNSYHFLIDDEDSGNYLLNSRYASPEEAKEFFDELEKNGYEWNGKMVVKSTSQPKFKVGDWIANDYCTGKVIALTDDAYLLDSGQGIPFSCEHNAHLWTIRDAKDGDVLAAQECYVIFKEIKGLNIKCHCTCHYMGFNPSFDINTLQNKTAFHPATKEQRDLLFQKMHEAGYEWNADTKKLIKTTIPIPKFKVDDIIKHKPTGQINTIKYVCSEGEYYVLDNNNILYFEAQDIWELVASKVEAVPQDKVPTSLEIYHAVNNIKSLENKVSVLADEILELKKRVDDLEIQGIKQCSNKIRLDSLESKMIILESHNINNRLNALESMVFPIPDIYKSSDKAGNNVTLEEMKS